MLCHACCCKVQTFLCLKRRNVSVNVAGVVRPMLRNGLGEHHSLFRAAA
jgi:hypothetical protein